MSTFTNLLFHVVYSTKYRQNSIVPEWEDEMYGYIGGIVREEKGILLKIGGMPDHVHLLAKFPPTIAVSDMLRLIKTNSSKWVNERPDVKSKFEWQSGYGAFSVSESQVPIVSKYIANQKEHHKNKSFEDEYLETLKRHGIQYDLRYVFEKEVIE
jgi:putative transposase